MCKSVLLLTSLIVLAIGSEGRGDPAGRPFFARAPARPKTPKASSPSPTSASGASLRTQDAHPPDDPGHAFAVAYAVATAVTMASPGVPWLVEPADALQALLTWSVDKGVALAASPHPSLEARFTSQVLAGP